MTWLYDVHAYIHTSLFHVLYDGLLLRTGWNPLLLHGLWLFKVVLGGLLLIIVLHNGLQVGQRCFVRINRGRMVAAWQNTSSLDLGIQVVCRRLLCWGRQEVGRKLWRVGRLRVGRLLLCRLRVGWLLCRLRVHWLRGGWLLCRLRVHWLRVGWLLCRLRVHWLRVSRQWCGLKESWLLLRVGWLLCWLNVDWMLLRVS